MTRSLLTACISAVLLGLAVPAIAQTPEATPAPEAYRLDVLTPGSMYAFSPNQPAFLGGSRNWSATLDGESIGEARFYQTVGRYDLARQTNRRHTRAALLTAVGVIAGVGGAVLVARGTPTVRGCRSCDIFQPELALPGAALMVGGLVSVSLALPLTKRAVPAREAAAEARRFNADGR